jgi:hypothetical protein
MANRRRSRRTGAVADGQSQHYHHCIAQLADQAAGEANAATSARPHRDRPDQYALVGVF